VLLVKGTSLGLLSPLFQPPIYFKNPQSQEPHRSAFYELSQALSERDYSYQWPEKYGISGRRLRLQCSRWDMDETTFAQVKSILKDNGLQVSQLSPSNGLEVQKNSLPVSSLTRTILKKCWEIH
jgi:hypothetical protein